MPLRHTEDSAKTLGEANKLNLFGLASKRVLFGKKPEEYIVLQSLVRKERTYVRIHGIYSAEYLVAKTFPLV